MSEKNHKTVGLVHDIQLTAFGSYAYVLVKRESPEKTPIVLGQFIILVSEDSSTSYLCVAEEYKPDLPANLATKEAMRATMKAKNKIPLDALYKEQLLDLGYKCRLLGVCKEELGSVKFFSNVRSTPAQHLLKAAIPSPEFMRKLFRNAIEANDNDEKPVIFGIGSLRYGTNPDDTEAYAIGTDAEVEVQFNVTNLLRKRTGIFGKSGYGKSNTVKAVIGMLAKERPNCGQLILDTNGEYARDNNQNDGLMDIFHEAGHKRKVILYTNRTIGSKFISKYGEDAIRPLRFDVFANIRPAFELVEANLEADKEPMYLTPWISAVLNEDDPNKYFSDHRNPGLIFGIFYQALMLAGLKPVNPTHALSSEVKIKREYLNQLAKAAKLIDETDPNSKKTFDELDQASQATILQPKKIYKNNQHYCSKHITTMAEYASWYETTMKDDSSLKGFVEILKNPRRFYALNSFHAKPTEQNQYARSLGDLIFNDLKDNKIVILDLSSVNLKISKSLSKHIVGHLLNKASWMFGDDSQRTIFNKFDALVYIEEAQNYLGRDEVSSGGNIYERLAKEGRKFHLGLVYVTQQPSAIDMTITSQTENIIAMHLSNEADTLILNKIKDKFDPLTCRFLKDEAQKGLAYIYSEPHQPFVLPVQIKQFSKELIGKIK
jgi:hypothetical protein